VNSGMSGTGFHVGHRRAGKNALARLAKIVTGVVDVGVEPATSMAKAVITTAEGSAKGYRVKIAQRETYETADGVVEVRRRGGPRPADTYRANKVGGRMKNRDGLPHVFDRATQRSMQRQEFRSGAGRWDGVGSPNDLAAYRKQLVDEAAKTRAKKSRRKVKEVGALAGALALGVFDRVGRP
jgi:hypothetical protein